MFDRLFLDHPRSVGESYGAHLLVALSFGLRMIWAGLACVVHALVPGLFRCTGSRMIQTLHDEMVVNRHRIVPVPDHATAAGQPASAQEAYRQS
jgi:Family of unknown function (DUF6356)